MVTVSVKKFGQGRKSKKKVVLLPCTFVFGVYCSVCPHREEGNGWCAG